MPPTLRRVHRWAAWHIIKPLTIKPFRDTFVFRKPSTKLCCQFNTLPRTGFYGKLTVTYKALDEGPKGSSTSYNDSGGLVHLGSSVPGQSGWIYPQGPYVLFHQIATHVYYLTAAIVQSGKVSFSVQDDSAVVSAKLEVPGGCCLEPTPIEKGSFFQGVQVRVFTLNSHRLSPISGVR